VKVNESESESEIKSDLKKMSFASPVDGQLICLKSFEYSLVGTSSITQNVVSSSSGMLVHYCPACGCAYEMKQDIIGKIVCSLFAFMIVFTRFSISFLLSNL
jgi:hypothetical protein